MTRKSSVWIVLASQGFSLRGFLLSDSFVNMNRAKYRREFWRFKTSQGIETKCVCVLAGEKERARLLEKADKMARENGWKLL